MTTVPGSIFAIVTAAASVYGVPVELVAAIIQAESSFNPDAMGDRDAQGVPHSFGLMQLHDKGAGSGFSPQQLLDPNLNVEIGTRYLGECLRAFGGDLHLAISAYNGGIEQTRQRGWSYNELYVKTVLHYYQGFQEDGLEPEGPVPTPPLMGCRNTARVAVSAVLLKLARIAYPKECVEEMVRESQDRSPNRPQDLQGTWGHPEGVRDPLRDGKGVQRHGRA